VRSFKCVEREKWPGAREIEISGELDLAVSGRLRSALERAAASNANVLVDLTACEFIDVGALAILVEGHDMARARGRRLLLYGVGGQVRRVLSVTGLADTGRRSTVAPLGRPRAEPRRVEERPAVPDGLGIRRAPTLVPLQEVAASGCGSIL
jgi:anti-anti-sigma factor